MCGNNVVLMNENIININVVMIILMCNDMCV